MPFQKGQSGNPNGRPMKGTSKAEMLERCLDGRIDEYPDSPIKEIIKTLVERAKKEDMVAIKTALNYYFGMPTQKQILSTDDEEPFTINVREIKSK